MLTAAGADADYVIGGAISFARLVCCGLVVVSFALFAIDQANGASKHQVAEITTGAPTRSSSGTVAAAHPGEPRDFIDNAAKALTTPFRAVVHSSNQWIEQGFATVCALLLYGFGLGYLARYSQGRA
jgi:hypothetical protein